MYKYFIKEEKDGTILQGSGLLVPSGFIEINNLPESNIDQKTNEEEYNADMLKLQQEAIEQKEIENASD